MRVVDTDNFGGDYPDEHFVAGTDNESLSKEQAEQIAEENNKTLHDYSPRYWKVVKDDYVLKPGFEV